jgi:hypothetical protein
MPSGTPRTPMDMLVGAAGEAPKCIEHGEVSVHWYPTGAKPGDLCLCGKRRKDRSEVDG